MPPRIPDTGSLVDENSSASVMQALIAAVTNSGRAVALPDTSKVNRINGAKLAALVEKGACIETILRLAQTFIATGDKSSEKAVQAIQEMGDSVIRDRLTDDEAALEVSLLEVHDTTAARMVPWYEFCRQCISDDRGDSWMGNLGLSLQTIPGQKSQETVPEYYKRTILAYKNEAWVAKLTNGPLRSLSEQA